MSVIDKINKSASLISEDDIDSWIIPELMDHYRNRMEFWAKKAYDSRPEDQLPTVARRAFVESAKGKVRSALFTFLFNKQYWKDGRNINSYLIKTIKNLSNQIRLENQGGERVNIPICPACKTRGIKEFLIYESGFWRCGSCTDEMGRIEKKMRADPDSISEDITHLQARYRLCCAFAIHSRKGFKCLDCKKFIPASSRSEFGLICPYKDCIFSTDDINSLKVMNHPVSIVRRNVSLNTPIKPSDSNNDAGRSAKETCSFQDQFVAEIISPEMCVEMSKQYAKEYDLLLKVIDEQIDLIKRTNSAYTIIQKLLMYKAYKIMIDKYPEEMISYLVHRKQNYDFPIQARIFQEYADLVINYLPFSVEKGGEKIDILSLTDPSLSLFLDKSIFNTKVIDNHIIPNKTIETYVGGRKFKNYGPCFIGRLIDIIDDRSGKSILDKVKQYSFVQIVMDNSVRVGIPVTVSHFRIPSHYEMGSLVFLQRIRRHIVDSIYFRLHGKQRIIK
jgi:hypothetical protein